jgi:hypothetical protein
MAEIDAAYPRPEKPVEEVSSNPSGDLYENFPRHENELTSDYHLRRILHQQAKWREIQAKNGTLEAPPLMPPRLIHPDQYEGTGWL